MNPPSTEQMMAAVPPGVVETCKILKGAGYQAWTVGGAVRDLLLGKKPGDWDVTSNALPLEVQSLFPKTIPTGIEHGTITAIVGRGSHREHVEITTFRGEGAYTDSRRPDSVHFGVSLKEDLLRRDFVINAMAFDPIDGVLMDPFGGLEDLERRVLRAVGDASERFREDGLRVMRAVRFVSVLDFSLEAQTEAGMSAASASLALVAQERVRVELLKLLAGKAVDRALQVAERCGVLDVVLPEVHPYMPMARQRVSCATNDAVLRLAVLLGELGEDKVDAILRRLTMSNSDRRRILAMLLHHREFVYAIHEDVALRQHLSRVGRAASVDQLHLLQAEASCSGDAVLQAGLVRAQEILSSSVPLEIRDLNISGKILMSAMGIAGKEVGDTLRYLLEKVLEEPSRNYSEELLRLASAVNKKF